MNDAPAAVAVVLELRARPQATADVIRWFEENLADTRSFDGCRAAEAYTNPDDPESVVVLEQWRARSDHEAYGRWRDESGTLDGLQALLAAPLALRYLDLFKT